MCDCLLTHPGLGSRGWTTSSTRSEARVGDHLLALPDLRSRCHEQHPCLKRGGLHCKAPLGEPCCSPIRLSKGLVCHEAPSETHSDDRVHSQASVISLPHPLSLRVSQWHQTLMSGGWPWAPQCLGQVSAHACRITSAIHSFNSADTEQYPWCSQTQD